ncbi:MAG: 50S ribosome-binding GTPase [Candidatus Hydrogenedentes bacterium]|nr:50S ribosome-binding GTPase [Candidatus Hydrogenedentota bacterium]
MAETTQPRVAAPLPCVFFVGDYNAGKSSLINALLRRDALLTCREESRALPAFVSRSPQNEASFAALTRQGAESAVRTHDDFLSLRRPENGEAAYTALAARFPKTPFHRLVLVDSAGSSTDAVEKVRIPALSHPDRALLVVVTDVEYWSSKHNMDLIADLTETFGSHVIVVANKADHLNSNEIQRVSAKAPQRMEDFGIATPPRFFAVSARLESARLDKKNEYRTRTKARVLEMCDSAFDAFRVALYEFEAARSGPAQPPAFDELMGSPLAKSFIATQQGDAQ